MIFSISREDGKTNHHIMDFMEIVIIRFNDKPLGKGDIFDFLEGLLVEQDKEIKHEKISRFVNLDEYIVEEMSDMGKFSAIIEDNARIETEDMNANIVRKYIEYRDIDKVVRELGYKRDDVVRFLTKSSLLEKEPVVSKEDVAIPDSLKDEYDNDYKKYLDDIFS